MMIYHQMMTMYHFSKLQWWFIIAVTKNEKYLLHLAENLDYPCFQWIRLVKKDFRLWCSNSGTVHHIQNLLLWWVLLYASSTHRLLHLTSLFIHYTLRNDSGWRIGRQHIRQYSTTMAWVQPISLAMVPVRNLQSVGEAENHPSSEQFIEPGHDKTQFVYN